MSPDDRPDNTEEGSVVPGDEAVGEASIGESPDSDPNDHTDTRATRSTVKFPYSDLKDAGRVPAAIKNIFGTACEIDQLAGHFKQPVSSGTFRTRIAAAVAFGLVVSRKKRIEITELGDQVASGFRPALATAFLNIELYERVYREYRGKTLPADQGLTAYITDLGVVASQADRARQVMQRSAEYAGYFEAGRDRLIKPAGGTFEAKPREEEKPLEDGQPANGENGGPKMSEAPLLKALWDTLPEGKEFSTEQRKRFFTALAFNIDYVYGPPQDGGTLNPAGVADLWKTKE